MKEKMISETDVTGKSMPDDLASLQKSLQIELHNILQYWRSRCVDEANGGFYGKLDNDNNVNKHAPKGLVLNARILWTFAAASRMMGNEYLPMAERAFNYLVSFFADKGNGGYYWSVDEKGAPLDTKKQAYAQAFTLYGFSEYFLATRNELAKKEAINLFRLMEDCFYDKEFGGYTEALDVSWEPLDDLRLSDKDANEPKSMNTHLHILEAYTNLFRIWPDALLREKIQNLLRVFREKIVDATTGHLHLFFAMNWELRSAEISYGHDIEASWLLQEAAEVMGDKYWISTTKKVALQMAAAAAHGLDEDGGLWYEFDPRTNHFIYEKHWWPQAEALVGFFNAWELSGDEQWLRYAKNAWFFIEKHLLDKQNGEWFWGVDRNRNPLPHQDKAGFWKCPYHNGRACMELIKRINK